MTTSPDPHRGHRVKAEIIAHAMWLHPVFSRSPRDVEPPLAEHGLVVSYGSVRRWCLEFGRPFARKRRPRPGDTWHLGEVFIRVNGVLHHLRRAVDQHRGALDIMVQDRRNATAAKRFLKRLLTGLNYRPKRLVTFALAFGVVSGPAAGVSAGIARRSGCSEPAATVMREGTVKLLAFGQASWHAEGDAGTEFKPRQQPR